MLELLPFTVCVCVCVCMCVCVCGGGTAPAVELYYSRPNAVVLSPHLPRTCGKGGKGGPSPHARAHRWFIYAGVIIGIYMLYEDKYVCITS